MPPPLIEQLKPGGRMVIPVGSSFLTQYLLLAAALYALAAALLPVQPAVAGQGRTGCD